MMDAGAGAGAPESESESAAGKADDHHIHASSRPQTSEHVSGLDGNGIATGANTTDNIKQEEGEQANGGNSTNTTLRPSPKPSVKRRESQGAVQTSEPSERPGNKKRKRGASPPWQFPTAEQTTLKTADGRRISARFSNNNTATPTASQNESRARSSSLSAPPRSSRAPSPPWKKFEAEGPTTVQVDGKRKSGRVNRDLTEGAPKRISPRSKKVADPEQSHANGKATSSEKTHARKVSGPSPKKEGKQPRRELSPMNMQLDTRAKIAELQARLDAIQPSRSFIPEERPKSSHKRKRSNDGAKPPQLDGTVSPSSNRKTPRAPQAPQSPTTTHKPTPRLKLRFNAARHNIPPPHPSALQPPPVRPPARSIHQLLDDVDLREMQQPYMENERGPPDRAWFKQRAIRQAKEEAAMRSRILKESESGGLLSREQCSVYQIDAEPQPEPPTVYTHIDHLMNHVQNFRALQLREKKEHKLQAKKVANEALEYWKKKRGPTEEEIMAEQDRIFKLIYKQVVFDVKAKWELVAQHVQSKRLQAWEAEQEIKRQERLQEKLAKSESMVARQRGELDDSDNVDESGSQESDESSGEENMSADEAQGSDDEEEGGEMDEAALAAYKKAQGMVEPPEDDAVVEDGSGRTEGKEDVVMADLTETASGNTIQPEAMPLPQPPPEPAPADLFDEDPDEDASGEEFEPADIESQDEERGDDDEDGKEQPAMDFDFPSRRSRRSSAAVGASDTGEGGDTEENGIDLDSDDYDNDMDSTSGDEEVGSAAESDADDENEEEDDEEEDNPLLAFYGLSAKQIKRTSLPTPTTSAEGDSGDAGVLTTGDAGADTEAGAEEAEEHQEESDAVAEIPAAPQVEDEVQSPHRTAAQEPQAEADVEELEEPQAEADIEEVEAVSAAASEDDDTTSKQLVPQPVLLRGNLRSYQHAGLDWLASLYRNGTNGILADEMGLGKTIQTIALLAHLAEEYGCWQTHLVIVPTSVILNWVTEFQKFLPGFRVLAYYGTSEERVAKRKGWVNDPHLDDKSKRGYNVVVTSYNIALQDINALRNVPWHYLVLDEAHNIRNFHSQRWQMLIRLKTKGRLLLTGTPLQNSLTELWSLLTFLTAGDDDPAHGDLEEFLSHWRDPVREIFDAGVQTLSSEAQKVVDQLHISLRPFLLRRLKSEVEKDLPKKTESVVVCKLSKRQRQLYQEYMGLAEVKKSLAQGNVVSAGRVLLSLRRVCNHPDLFDPRGVESSWGMERSVAEEFGVREDVVRRLLGKNEEVLAKLMVVGREDEGRYAVKRARQLDARAKLTAELTKMESTQAQDDSSDPSAIASCQALRRVAARRNKLNQLRSAIRFSDERLANSPIYGSDLQEVVTIKRDRPYRVTVIPPPLPQPYGQASRVTPPPQPVVHSLRGWPQLGSRPLRFESEHPSDWLVAKDSMLQRSAQTYDTIGAKLQDTLTRFAFVTPAVTAPVLDHLIPKATQRNLRASPAYPTETDYAHEARVRLSIAFPDARLLVYDSGKLQRLTYLLRDLQAKGSRSLIFSQMAGTLNILEQFLSLMGLPYLRLDGGTSPERRHLYAQEFNRPDSKYQCMILSSRAGGVGLNLTGASSVIFYDLDWNPQMDRQCMDRAHRIGQVRDVEVFKMVSEKTVEENILRRAEQKSLLDRAVIQEGHFTTDYGVKPKDDGKEAEGEGGEEVQAAIERFLGAGGGDDKATAKALESVEDVEDVAAAQRAHREENQDEADFGASNRPTPGGEVVDEVAAREGHLDGWMVGFWEWVVRDAVFVPPVVRKERGRDRKGRRR